MHSLSQNVDKVVNFVDIFYAHTCLGLVSDRNSAHENVREFLRSSTNIGA
jgi:hypothetical protein